MNDRKYFIFKIMDLGTRHGSTYELIIGDIIMFMST